MLDHVSEGLLLPYFREKRINTIKPLLSFIRYYGI